MSVPPSAIRRMAELGLSSHDIADLCELIDARDTPGALEKRRAYDRERKRVLRKSGGKSGGQNADVSGGNPVDIPPDIPPLARVVDINPSTEITGTISSISKTRAMSDWKAMLIEAREAAGDVADFTRPAMLHAGDLRRLIEPLSGEPCEWSEVLDAIRMTCARQAARGKKLTTWAWVKDDAVALRDKRLTAHMPAPKVVELRPAFLTTAERGAAARAEGRRRLLEEFGERDEANNS